MYKYIYNICFHHSKCVPAAVQRVDAFANHHLLTHKWLLQKSSSQMVPAMPISHPLVTSEDFSTDQPRRVIMIIVRVYVAFFKVSLEVTAAMYLMLFS